jgi:hypothetical protein
MCAIVESPSGARQSRVLAVARGEGLCCAGLRFAWTDEDRLVEGNGARVAMTLGVVEPVWAKGTCSESEDGDLSKRCRERSDQSDCIFRRDSRLEGTTDRD